MVTHDTAGSPPDARWQARPSRPIRYWPIQRLADRFAGAHDGRAGIPDISFSDTASCTSYHATQAAWFDGAAERERLAMEFQIAPLSPQLETAQDGIVRAEQDATDARKRLDQWPATAPETVLSVRNVLEKHLDESVSRLRRQREYTTLRNELAAVEAAANQRARTARAAHRHLTSEIATIRRIYGTRVRIQFAHAERRCRTYERHLIRHHPDAVVLLGRLAPRRPQLPAWVLALDEHAH